MDDINDFARNAAIDLYGLTEQGFWAWLRYTGYSDLPPWFLDTCIVMNDRNILDPLIEKYWDIFESASMDAFRNGKEKKRMLWG